MLPIANKQYKSRSLGIQNLKQCKSRNLSFFHYVRKHSVNLDQIQTLSKLSLQQVKQKCFTNFCKNNLIAKNRRLQQIANCKNSQFAKKTAICTNIQQNTQSPQWATNHHSKKETLINHYQSVDIITPKKFIHIVTINSQHWVCPASTSLYRLTTFTFFPLSRKSLL